MRRLGLFVALLALVGFVTGLLGGVAHAENEGSLGE